MAIIGRKFALETWILSYKYGNNNKTSWYLAASDGGKHTQDVDKRVGISSKISSL